MERLRAWAATETGGWIIIGGLILVALIVLSLVAYQLQLRPENPEDASVPRPAGPVAAVVQEFTLSPDALQNLTFDQARAYNATLPFSTAPNPPARRFVAPTDDIESYHRALDCLTAAIYYEAASETAAGQAAVAQVVINRSRHPAFPRTICGVVFEGSQRTTGCQFTFTCDGALARVPSREGWTRARAVATAALNGFVATGVGLATHYHTDWVAPYWAPRLTKLVQIGTHIFYTWKGVWGLPAAFSGDYASPEPVIGKMSALASPVEILQIDALQTPIDTLDPVLLPNGVLRAGSGLDAPTDDEAEDAVEEVLPIAPPPAPSIAQQAAERSARETTAAIADPLANPAQARPQRRQRLPAPSSW
jgi:hypothetical protein